MALGVALQAVTDGLKALTSQLKLGVAAGNNTDEALRALGTSFDQQAGPLTQSMDNLRGSLSDRLVPTILSMQAGLQGNTLGVQQLINQQKITGTQFQGTATAFANLAFLSTMQEEAMNQLSTDLIDVGAQFGVTTDVLVKALDGLKDNMVDIDLMGLPDHIISAVTKGAAQFGPQGAAAFEKIVDLILDPSIDAIGKRALFGLANAQEMLRNTTSQAEAMKLLNEFVKIGSTQFESIARSDLPGQLGAAIQIFGPEGELFTQLSNGLTENQREQNEVVQAFGDSFNNIRKEIFVPLQSMFMQVLTPVMERLAQAFKAVNDEHLPKFVHFLENGINVLLGWIGQIPSVMANVLDGLHSVFISVSMMDFGGIWEDMKNIFAFGGSVFNDFILDIKLMAAEVRIQAHKIANPLESIGDAFFGGTMDPNGPLAKLMQARDEANIAANPFGPTKTEFLQGQSNEAITRLEQRFEMFQINFEKGDMGTKFFGPVIEPWTAIFTGMAEDTKKTAEVLTDATEGDTRPGALDFLGGEATAAMRDILGIPDPAASQRLAAEQLEVLVEIREGQDASFGEAALGRVGLIQPML